MAIRFKERIRRLEATLLPPAKEVPKKDIEFARIATTDPQARALLAESEQIVVEGLAGRPDAEELRRDQHKFLPALDVPTLRRLRGCLERLHARVDSLRRNPKPHP